MKCSFTNRGHTGDGNTIKFIFYKCPIPNKNRTIRNGYAGKPPFQKRAFKPVTISKGGLLSKDSSRRFAEEAAAVSTLPHFLKGALRPSLLAPQFEGGNAKDRREKERLILGIMKRFDGRQLFRIQRLEAVSGKEGFGLFQLIHVNHKDGPLVTLHDKAVGIIDINIHI